jgi:acetolactate synthase-1/3 small subunit
MEMALLKVKTTASARTIIQKYMKEYQAKLLDDKDGVLIMSQMGTTDELNTFEGIMSKYGLTEMVRTGKLLMTKGKEST